MSKVQELADRVNKMTGADQLRLAAGLLDKGDAETAAILIQRVSDELALIKLLGLGKR